MSKTFDEATVEIAGGVIAKVSVSRNGNVYFTAPQFGEFTATITTGKETNSRIQIRPMGSSGQGKLIDKAMIVTPDDKFVIVRTRESGLVTIEIEGAWGLTWNTVVKGSGWHVAARQFV